MEVNPLSIILVKSDSKGDRLLFRYPYRVESNETSNQNKRRNPYSVPAQEDILQSPPPQTSNIHQGKDDFIKISIHCGKFFFLNIRHVSHLIMNKSLRALRHFFH